MYSESLEGTDQENLEEDREVTLSLPLVYKDMLWKEKVMVREGLGRRVAQESYCCANMSNSSNLQLAGNKTKQINTTPGLSCAAL